MLSVKRSKESYKSHPPSHSSRIDISNSSAFPNLKQPSERGPQSKEKGEPVTLIPAVEAGRAARADRSRDPRRGGDKDNAEYADIVRQNNDVVYRQNRENLRRGDRSVDRGTGGAAASSSAASGGRGIAAGATATAAGSPSLVNLGHLRKAESNSASKSRSWINTTVNAVSNMLSRSPNSPFAADNSPIRVDEEDGSGSDKNRKFNDARSDRGSDGEDNDSKKRPSTSGNGVSPELKNRKKSEERDPSRGQSRDRNPDEGSNGGSGRRRICFSIKHH